MNTSLLNIWIIIQREFLTRVRKKTFIITTLLAPLGLAALIIVPALINIYSNEKQTIAVIDDSNLIQNSFADSDKLFFKSVTQNIDTFKKKYKNEGFDGILYIPNLDPALPIGITYYADNELPLRLQNTLEERLNDLVEKIRIKNAGLDASIIKNFRPNISIVSTVLGENEKQGNATAASILGYFCAFALYIILIGYGAAVMKGVSEEKTNRIVEVLISTVKPMHLMLGKIVGIGLVGLLQFVLWVVLALLINVVAALLLGVESQVNSPEIASLINDENAITSMQNTLNEISKLNWILILPSFLFYFLGGYFLYAALFAAVGSATNEETDAQSFSFPIMIPIIISITLMTTVIDQPHGTLAVWASMIPFTSPIIMMSRIGFGVPVWQLALSMILLMVGFIFTTWISAKIYSVGILLQGKKITFMDMLRWIKN